MPDLKFTRSHEWVKSEGDRATVGITDYAQSQLGDIVFIELPKIGEKIKQSAQLGTIESTKAASEIYTPLSGEVIEVNDELVNSPQLINESPYESGWMVKVKIADPAELNNLMDETAYKEYIEVESH